MSKANKRKTSSLNPSETDSRDDETRKSATSKNVQPDQSLPPPAKKTLKDIGLPGDLNVTDSTIPKPIRKYKKRQSRTTSGNGVTMAEYISRKGQGTGSIIPVNIASNASTTPVFQNSLEVVSRKAKTPERQEGQGRTAEMGIIINGLSQPVYTMKQLLKELGESGYFDVSDYEWIHRLPFSGPYIKKKLSLPSTTISSSSSESMPRVENTDKLSGTNGISSSTDLSPALSATNIISYPVTENSPFSAGNQCPPLPSRTQVYNPQTTQHSIAPTSVYPPSTPAQNYSPISPRFPYHLNPPVPGGEYTPVSGFSPAQSATINEPKMTLGASFVPKLGNQYANMPQNTLAYNSQTQTSTSYAMTHSSVDHPPSITTGNYSPANLPRLQYPPIPPNAGRNSSPAPKPAQSVRYPPYQLRTSRSSIPVAELPPANSASSVLRPLLPRCISPQSLNQHPFVPPTQAYTPPTTQHSIPSSDDIILKDAQKWVENYPPFLADPRYDSQIQYDNYIAKAKQLFAERYSKYCVDENYTNQDQQSQEISQSLRNEQRLQSANLPLYSTSNSFPGMSGKLLTQERPQSAIPPPPALLTLLTKDSNEVSGSKIPNYPSTSSETQLQNSFNASTESAFVPPSSCQQPLVSRNSSSSSHSSYLNVPSGFRNPKEYFSSDAERCPGISLPLDLNSHRCDKCIPKSIARECVFSLVRNSSSPVTELHPMLLDKLKYVSVDKQQNVERDAGNRNSARLNDFPQTNEPRRVTPSLANPGLQLTSTALIHDPIVQDNIGLKSSMASSLPDRKPEFETQNVIRKAYRKYDILINEINKKNMEMENVPLNKPITPDVIPRFQLREPPPYHNPYRYPATHINPVSGPQNTRVFPPRFAEGDENPAALRPGIPFERDAPITRALLSGQANSSSNHGILERNNYRQYYSGNSNIYQPEDLSMRAASNNNPAMKESDVISAADGTGVSVIPESRVAKRAFSYSDISAAESEGNSDSGNTISPVSFHGKGEATSDHEEATTDEAEQIAQEGAPPAENYSLNLKAGGTCGGTISTGAGMGMGYTRESFGEERDTDERNCYTTAGEAVDGEISTEPITDCDSTDEEGTRQEAVVCAEIGTGPNISGNISGKEIVRLNTAVDRGIKIQPFTGGKISEEVRTDFNAAVIEKIRKQPFTDENPGDEANHFGTPVDVEMATVPITCGNILGKEGFNLNMVVDEEINTEPITDDETMDEETTKFRAATDAEIRTGLTIGGKKSEERKGSKLGAAVEGSPSPEGYFKDSVPVIRISSSETDISGFADSVAETGDSGYSNLGVIVDRYIKAAISIENERMANNSLDLKTLSAPKCEFDLSLPQSSHPTQADALIEANQFQQIRPLATKLKVSSLLDTELPPTIVLKKPLPKVLEIPPPMELDVRPPIGPEAPKPIGLKMSPPIELKKPPPKKQEIPPLVELEVQPPVVSEVPPPVVLKMLPTIESEISPPPMEQEILPSKKQEIPPLIQPELPPPIEPEIQPPIQPELPPNLVLKMPPSMMPAIPSSIELEMRSPVEPELPPSIELETTEPKLPPTVALKMPPSLESKLQSSVMPKITPPIVLQMPQTTEPEVPSPIVLQMQPPTEQEIPPPIEREVRSKMKPEIMTPVPLKTVPSSPTNTLSTGSTSSPERSPIIQEQIPAALPPTTLSPIIATTPLATPPNTLPLKQPLKIPPAITQEISTAKPSLESPLMLPLPIPSPMPQGLSSATLLPLSIPPAMPQEISIAMPLLESPPMLQLPIPPSMPLEISSATPLPLPIPPPIEQEILPAMPPLKSKLNLPLLPTEVLPIAASKTRANPIINTCNSKNLQDQSSEFIQKALANINDNKQFGVSISTILSNTPQQNLSGITPTNGITTLGPDKTNLPLQEGETTPFEIPETELLEMEIPIITTEQEVDDFIEMIEDENDDAECILAHINPADTFDIILLIDEFSGVSPEPPHLTPEFSSNQSHNRLVPALGNIGELLFLLRQVYSAAPRVMLAGDRTLDFGGSQKLRTLSNVWDSVENGEIATLDNLEQQIQMAILDALCSVSASPCDLVELRKMKVAVEKLFTDHTAKYSNQSEKPSFTNEGRIIESSEDNKLGENDEELTALFHGQTAGQHKSSSKRRHILSPDICSNVVEGVRIRKLDFKY